MSRRPTPPSWPERDLQISAVIHVGRRAQIGQCEWPHASSRGCASVRLLATGRHEPIRAKEHPGRQVLSEWSKNGRIGAQGWLYAAHVPPFQPLGGGGRGDSI